MNSFIESERHSKSRPIPPKEPNPIEVFENEGGKTHGAALTAALRWNAGSKDGSKRRHDNG